LATQPAMWALAATSPQGHAGAIGKPASAVQLTRGMLSKTQRKGLMEACRVHFTDPWWQREDKALSAFSVVTAAKQLIQLHCGARCWVTGASLSAKTSMEDAPPTTPSAPLVGVGRPTVHALYQLRTGEPPAGDPYVAEVVAFLAVTCELRSETLGQASKLYALAQFHEVRRYFCSGSVVQARPHSLGVPVGVCV
jgi:hypothetical protein